MKAKSSFTEFTAKVYSAVKNIRKGRVATYKSIAKAIGFPSACRAVGNALNKNTNPSVPCHRVVKSDMSVGGFRHGTPMKISMLKSEGVAIRDGRVVAKGKL